MKTISMRLSKRSIDEAIEELKAYKQELNNKCQLLVKRFAEKGIENVKYILVSNGARPNGTLLSGLERNPTKGMLVDGDKVTGFVTVSSQYAVYVEFGTGIIGSRSPHDEAGAFGWAYDVNNHGEAGWWYPTDESDPNPTKFHPPGSDVWLAWSNGEPAMSFMYDTALKLRDEFYDTVKEVFEI